MGDPAGEQARRAEHLDRAGKGFLLRETLLPAPPCPGQGTPACSQDEGRVDAASSGAPCWLRPGTQGMRAPAQERLHCGDGVVESQQGSDVSEKLWKGREAQIP